MQSKPENVSHSTGTLTPSGGEERTQGERGVRWVLSPHQGLAALRVLLFSDPREEFSSGR